MQDQSKSFQTAARGVLPERENESGTSRSELEPALIALLGLSLPFANYPFFSWRGFGVDLSHLIGGLLLLVAARDALFRRRELPPIPLLLCSLAVLLVPFVPYTFHRLPGFSVPQFWKTLFHIAFLIGVFLAIGSSRCGDARFRRILTLLTCEAVLISLFGIWQSIAFSRRWPTGIGLLNRYAAHELRGEAGRGWRATATFEEPKWLAIYLLPPLCYAYGLAVRALREGRERIRNGWITMFLLIAAGVFATVSLGQIPVLAILSALAFAHFVRLLRRKRERIVALAGLAVLLFLFAFWALSSRSVLSQLLRIRVAAETTCRTAADSHLAPSWAYRENLRYASLVFRESPWFGIGAGQFSPVGAVRGRQLGIPPELTKDGPWVGLGGLLAELGVAGLAALAMLVAAILRPGSRSTRPSVNPYGAMAALLVTAVFLKEASAGFYVHFSTWFPLGIAALAARLEDGG